MRALFALLILLVAGCTAPLATEAPAYTLTATIPDEVRLGAQLAFTLNVEGTETFATDHIGAHWWTSSQADPTAALSTSTGCAHVEGQLPGDYAVSCTFDAPGVYYVRGHARVDVEGVLHNYWTDEQVVHAVPEPNQWILAVDGIPTEVTQGQEFTFTLTIDGEPEVSSEHIGGHWWRAGEAAENDLSMSVGGCSHTQGTAPGTYTVTCDMEAKGEFEVFGHLRVTVGEKNYEFWSESYPVTVS